MCQVSPTEEGERCPGAEARRTGAGGHTPAAHAEASGEGADFNRDKRCQWTLKK